MSIQCTDCGAVASYGNNLAHKSDCPTLWAEHAVRLSSRHTYKPNRRYPWFCDLCGYPASETLKHLPATAEGGER